MHILAVLKVLESREEKRRWQATNVVTMRMIFPDNHGKFWEFLGKT